MKRIITKVLLVFFFFSITFYLKDLFAQSEFDKEGWVMFKGNPARLGVCDYGKPLLNPEVKWTAEVGIQGWLNNPLAIGDTLYTSSFGKVWNKPDSKDGVYALKIKNGDILWHFHTPNDANGVAFHDNVIYVCCDDGNLYAIDAQKGKLIWEFRTEEKLYTNPLIIEDTIYIGGAAGYLYALSTKGKLRWVFTSGAKIRSSPAYDNKGYIYFGNAQGNLFCLEAKKGNIEGYYPVKWEYAKGEYVREEYMYGIYSTPVVYKGKVYFGCNYLPDFRYYALDIKTGEETWKAEGGVAVKASPVVFEDLVYFVEVNYVGENWNKLTAFDAETGEKVWSSGENQKGGWSSPLVVGNIVYFIDEGGVLCGYEAKTGKLKAKLELNDKVFASPIYHQGFIFVGGDKGYLYAIGDKK